MRRYHGRLKRSKALRRWKRRLAKKDASCIPKGPYCYTRLPKPPGDTGWMPGPILACPYWRGRPDRVRKRKHMETSYGYCEYMETGDWAQYGSVPGPAMALFDMCKDCGVNWDEEGDDAVS